VNVQIDKIVELLSLGIHPSRISEFDIGIELEDLIESIKQSMFQDYKLAYSDKGGKLEEEAMATVSI
jgi:hypothetical protein